MVGGFSRDPGAFVHQDRSPARTARARRIDFTRREFRSRPRQSDGKARFRTAGAGRRRASDAVHSPVRMEASTRPSAAALANARPGGARHSDRSRAGAPAPPRSLARLDRAGGGGPLLVAAGCLAGSKFRPPVVRELLRRLGAPLAARLGPHLCQRLAESDRLHRTAASCAAGFRAGHGPVFAH